MGKKQEGKTNLDLIYWCKR